MVNHCGLRSRCLNTTFGRDTAAELSLRILRGLSVEFQGHRGHGERGHGPSHRVISKAEMFGFGVVDRPAYPGSTGSDALMGRVPRRVWARSS